MFRDCWKRKQVRAWKADIRRLAQSLGEARDRDVLIEFLVSSLAAVSDPAMVPGIACFLNHVERRRQWAQPRVLEAIDRWESSGAMEAIRASMRAVLDEAGDAEVVAGGWARRQAEKNVRRRLVNLLDESPGLADPDQHERHHAMRIAVKRLRYTLELARPLCSGELAEIGDAVKKLQTLLGEIHDCDVWIKNLDQFARKEAARLQFCFGGPQRFERLRPGLDYLREQRKAHRDRVFGELVAFWQTMSDQGTWDRLATVLKPDSAEPPSPSGL